MNLAVYRVDVVPWAKGWELHVAGVGVTQAHALHEFETMARSFVSGRLNVPAASFGLVWNLPTEPRPGWRRWFTRNG